MNTMMLTEKGRQLMAKIEAGGLPLEITRILTGQGTSEDPERQTQVQGPMKELGIAEKQVDEGKAIIRTMMTNEDIEEEYDIWQIGIYAEDPEEGEVLYRIMQFDTPRKVPSVQETVWAYAPEFTFSTGNATTVKVYVNQTGYVLRSELRLFDCGYFTDEEDQINEHNLFMFAHRNMFLDGNATHSSSAVNLESHEVDPFAHANLNVDGNR